MSSSPRVVVTGWNSWGDMTVWIGDKQYHYKDVPEFTYYKLDSLLKHNNKSAVFKILNGLVLDQEKMPQPKNQLDLFARK
jgi:hypothetical protein